MKKIEGILATKRISEKDNIFSKSFQVTALYTPPSGQRRKSDGQLNVRGLMVVLFFSTACEHPDMKIPGEVGQ